MVYTAGVAEIGIRSRSVSTLCHDRLNNFLCWGLEGDYMRENVSCFYMRRLSVFYKQCQASQSHGYLISHMNKSRMCLTNNVKLPYHRLKHKLVCQYNPCRESGRKTSTGFQCQPITVKNCTKANQSSHEAWYISKNHTPFANQKTQKSNLALHNLLSSTLWTDVEFQSPDQLLHCQGIPA